ncbi:MAG: ABC transporter substrate binding protein [Campylobacterales bacterium]
MLKMFFLLTLFLTTTTLADDIKKNILLLHSYHSDMTWVENIETAVEEILEPEYNNYLIYKEYMDTKRHNSKEYYKALINTYKKKYKNKKIDLILATDNNAFDFLLKHRDEIFGETPVVFSGVNGFDMGMIEDKKGFTGVAEQFSAKETVDVILKLQPDIKEIFIINDYLKTGRAWEKDIKKALQGYDKKVKLTYNDNLTLQELKQKIDSLDKNSAVLMGVYFADKDGNYITYEKIGKYLLGDSKAPVYALLNFNVNNNVIGGKVIGGYSQGKAMSISAKKVLEGRNPENIPITFSSANEYVFNFSGMQKHSIDKSLLPEGSIVINEPYSLFKQYRELLITLLILFVLIAAVLLLIIFYIKQKESDEANYKERLIIFLLRYLPVILSPIITLAIILMFLSFAEKSNKSIIEIERTHYLDSMKELTKREVERYIQIVQKRLQAVKKDGNSTDIEDTKQNLLKLADAISYGKNGYIFVGSMDGIMLSHPEKSLVGVSFFDGKHENIKKVFLKFKEQIDKSSAGFVTYKWENPTTNELEDKLTYVSSIPETNWYVASGVYEGDFEHFVGDRIKATKELEEQRMLYLIAISSVIILLSIIISLLLSQILKKVFENYKNSIKKELEKNKKQAIFIEQQSKMAELGMMMGAILHQWKQPLNVLNMLGYNIEEYLAERGEEGNEDILHAQKTLNAQIVFMNETIENFRKFSSPSGVKSNFFVCQVVEKIKKMFRSQFEKQGVEITLKECEDFKVYGIEGEMMQVVLNILVNAKDALLSNKVEDKKITITSHIYEDKSVLKFRDNAGGIKEELLQKIFEPHFSTKGEKGTGIGLYICRKIIEEKYNGTISAQNTAEGAEFTLEFPTSKTSCFQDLKEAH